MNSGRLSVRAWRTPAARVLRRNPVRLFRKMADMGSLQPIVTGCCAVALLLGACSFTLVAHAQAYPSKVVRIIVPSAAGFGDDIPARQLASKLSEILGQQFVVDNRPGAGGMIGQTLVAKSPPDGYTLLLAGGSMAGARYVNANVTYDVLHDFTHVSLIETSPFVLIVHPSVPVRDLKTFIALARSRPGKMAFGSIGAGQIPYWGVMLFNSMARIDAVEIQYKAGLVVAVLSGEIDYAVISAVNTVANRAKLRALGVTTTKRSPMLPDVPTMDEAALPGYDMPAWRSIVGPAGMSRDIVTSLNSAIGRALAMPDLRDMYLKAGSEPITSSPEELRKRFADWIVIFGKIAKDVGIKPQ
jgi:tripartite-type tricarboxylate transporter receptor subunit TctC